MTAILGLIIGIGLSATCGFRVFVPLLGMSIAQRAEVLNLSSGFEWVGSDIAFYTFIIALIIEVGAYYIPWVDLALDTIATPMAIGAGILVMAAMLGDVSPFWRWSLAAVAGGGAAATTQLSSVALRGTSTAVTGGLGNPIVSTLELIFSVLSTILAIMMPVLGLIVICAVVYSVMQRGRTWRARRGPGRRIEAAV